MGLTAYMMGDYDIALSRLAESITVNPDGDQTSAWAHLGLIAPVSYTHLTLPTSDLV